MKLFFAILLFFFVSNNYTAAQTANCVFGQPIITIDFGTGRGVRDFNSRRLYAYDRVGSYCPTDGYYTFTSYTENCHGGDWFTLPEDHTPGDAEGNMLLVNASYEGGDFFNTDINGLKGNTIYEFGLWLMNVCRLSDKCPFPLLPDITITLKTSSGKTVARFATGGLPRRTLPHWTQYRAVFTMPAGESILHVNMIDNNLGGCGNDFTLDDITIRECIIKPPVTVTKKQTPVPAKKTTVAKPVAKKEVLKPAPVRTKERVRQVQTTTNTPATTTKTLKQKPAVFAPPPAILVNRANPPVKKIETASGSIKIDLYDNGEIDGDTVSIYHNNEPVVLKAKLSQKPISFRITVDPASPHHELIMVANNLGSIPPNTSLMIVTANEKRYEVFISSTEQKNAKVMIDLQE